MLPSPRRRWRSRISILHKYDYHSRRLSRRRRRWPFQFYISTIIIEGRTIVPDGKYQISILHKYDYHQIKTDPDHLSDSISILHKYDYHPRRQAPAQPQATFQFYISTIIIPSTIYHHRSPCAISILHKYDYHRYTTSPRATALIFQFYISTIIMASAAIRAVSRLDFNST